ncbi:MAG: hypothetical protein ABI606_16800 [Rhodoferax sp.]
MKIELNLNDETQRFLEELKREFDALIVPKDKWILYVQDNPQIPPEDMPKYMLSGDFVITEREWFIHVIKRLKKLYLQPPRRLTKEEGGFNLVEILEPKKKIPSKDIFDAGHRVSGSFGSNGNY